MTLRVPRSASHLAVALASTCWLAFATPAAAQDDPAPPTDAVAVVDENTDQYAVEDIDSGPETDIFSRNTLSLLLDGRLVVASGAESWVDGGLGKTRFDGDGDSGDFTAQVVPVEAAVVWTPRFSRSFSANVSAAWQRDHDRESDFDLIEAFVNFLPPRTGPIGFSARAGLMWPEISLEHSTGGAWTVVNTITPSAINSWVGEEVKVLGVEGTVSASLGEHELAATAGVFEYNDTSGTLLSFRGWALHDMKATANGYFPLPPFNEFISHLQEDRTRSYIDFDYEPGYYARLDWRPPQPFGVAVFYYDNMGDPEAFTPEGQWGWRTKFWNVGFNANLGPDTRVIAQGMTGSTIMGFDFGDGPWVDTDFDSAFVMVTHMLGDVAVSGRLETFSTDEHGSEMSHADESEDGWAWTAAARVPINDNLTVMLEALNVRSERGRRRDLGLSSDFESQTVFQVALRLRL